MEFEEAYDKFCAIYEPLRKKYGWLKRSKFSLYEEGYIEIYEADTKKHILRASGTDEIECYMRAAAALEIYRKGEKYERDNRNVQILRAEKSDCSA